MNPEILVRRGVEPALVGTIVVSALVHATLVALMIAIPGRFVSTPQKPQSYTVDLVAPDVLGGTNLVPGGGKAKEPAGPPAPPAVEPKPAPPAPAAKAADPAPVAPPPEPPPVAKAAEPAKPVEAPKPPEPPSAAKPAPKAPEPPPVAAKPADAKPVEPPKPAPAIKPAEVKPVAKAPEPPKVDAKAMEPPKPVPPAAKPAAKPAPAPANPPQAETQKTSEVQKDAGTEKAAKKVDDQIAAAVQRRAAQVAADSQNVDKQIAAAVQRRAQQVQQGGGSGPPGAGGPISLGPGSGVGGTTADLQYILYQGRMEQRIKAAWAWAGADKQLQAVVQFNLTPEGEIKNVHTTQSSGDRQYDASCERAVRAANPLEAVPEKYRKEFATVEMTFKPSDIGR